MLITEFELTVYNITTTDLTNKTASVSFIAMLEKVNMISPEKYLALALEDAKFLIYRKTVRTNWRKLVVKLMLTAKTKTLCCHEKYHDGSEDCPDFIRELFNHGLFQAFV